MKTHILNEETKLFPYINALNNLKNKQGVYSEVNELSKYSIDQCMEEHDDVESDLKVIKSLIIENSEIDLGIVLLLVFKIKNNPVTTNIDINAPLDSKMNSAEKEKKRAINDMYFSYLDL